MDGGSVFKDKELIIKAQKARESNPNWRQYEIEWQRKGCEAAKDPEVIKRRLDTYISSGQCEKHMKEMIGKAAAPEVRAKAVETRRNNPNYSEFMNKFISAAHTKEAMAKAMRPYLYKDPITGNVRKMDRSHAARYLKGWINLGPADNNINPNDYPSMGVESSDSK